MIESVPRVLEGSNRDVSNTNRPSHKLLCFYILTCANNDACGVGVKVHISRVDFLQYDSTFVWISRRWMHFPEIPGILEDLLTDILECKEVGTLWCTL